MTHTLTKFVLIVLLCGAVFSVSAQNVGINTSGTTPSANAILDLNTGNTSRDPGFIIPHVKLTSLTTFNPPIANTNTTSDTAMVVYNTNAAIGNGAGCYVWNGGSWVFAGYISNKDNYQASPTNPTGTTSTTAKMMGLKGNLTPTSSGTYLIIVSGYTINTRANTNSLIQIYTGTSTAPNNAATLTGTAQGTQLTATVATANTEDLPFCVSALVTSLTVGTTYWLDISLASSNAGGTASVKSLSVSAIEQ